MPENLEKQQHQSRCSATPSRILLRFYIKDLPKKRSLSRAWREEALNDGGALPDDEAIGISSRSLSSRSRQAQSFGMGRTLHS
jgi:hypothetical protein